MYMNMFGHTEGGQSLLSSVFKQKGKEPEESLTVGSSSNGYVIKSVFSFFFPIPFFADRQPYSTHLLMSLVDPMFYDDNEKSFRSLHHLF